jgi:hypothetical protein
MLKSSKAFVVAALASAVPVLAAQAVTVERQEVRMSADVCQPALPAFDAAFRKRPLAIVNEGSASAYITCAFGGVFNGIPSVKTATVGFTNTGSSARTVNCTLVDAHAGVMDPDFFPKTISVPAAGSPVALLIWSAINDNGGTRFTYPAASCSLPPGVGVQVTNHTYDEDVGQ